MNKYFIESANSDAGIALTFSDFLHRVSEVKAYILAAFPNEKFIALDSDDRLRFLIAYFAVIESGKIAVLLNYKLPEATRSKQLESIGCRAILNFSEIKSDYRADAEQATLQDFTAQLFNSATPSTVIFTSGSTGQSKPVILCGKAFACSACSQVRNLCISDTSAYLLSLPLYHVSGLSILYRCLASGAEVILSTENANPINDIMHKTPTHLSLVSTQFARLIASLTTLPKKEQTRIVSGITAILLGGSAISASLKSVARQLKLPAIYGYGSTETASAVCITNSESRPDSSGFPINFCKIKISSAGEILIKSETLALGYLQMDESISPITDADGYFHTGDIGTFSATEGLCVIGRKDNMFISGGENIYPEEIEKALCELPQIDFAIVISIEDEEFGHSPLAFVKRKTAISNEEICRELKHSLPNYKIPKRIKDIPAEYSPSGIKPNRTELKKLAGN